MYATRLSKTETSRDNQDQLNSENQAMEANVVDLDVRLRGVDRTLRPIYNNSSHFSDPQECFVEGRRNNEGNYFEPCKTRRLTIAIQTCFYT